MVKEFRNYVSQTKTVALCIRPGEMTLKSVSCGKRLYNIWHSFYVPDALEISYCIVIKYLHNFRFHAVSETN